MTRFVTVSVPPDAVRPARSSTLAASALIAVLACGSAVALGQDRPSAQPLPPPPIPVVDTARWADSYQRAGRPRVLVLAGEGTGQARGLSPAALLSNEDDAAISSKLRVSFLEALNTPEADLDVVADSDWRAALARLRANTDLNRERDASRLIAQQLEAELLIVLRLVKSQRQGSPFAVVVEASDAARGRQGLTFTYDWKGPLDALEFKEYAAEMAIKFTDDYARRVGNPVRHTVQLFGLTMPEQQRLAKDALASLSGVRTVRTRTSAALTGGRSEEGIVEFEIAFAPGTFADSTDIKAEAAAAFASRGFGVEDRQTEPGRIAMRLLPDAYVPKPSVLPAPLAATGDATTAAGTPSPVQGAPAVRQPASIDDACASGKPLSRTQRLELFQGVRDTYAAAGAPRVVVLINRAATHDEGERLAAETGSTPGSISVISVGNGNAIGVTSPGRPAAPPPATGARFVAVAPLEAHSRRFETELSRSLQFGLGFTRQISPDLARARLLTAAGERRTVASDELLGTLAREDVADIAIVAWGYAVADAAGRRIEYTFEAVDLKTSQRLASGVASGDAESDDLDMLMGDMADDAATQLACGLRSTWTRR